MSTQWAVTTLHKTLPTARSSRRYLLICEWKSPIYRLCTNRGYTAPDRFHLNKRHSIEPAASKNNRTIEAAQGGAPKWRTVEFDVSDGGQIESHENEQEEEFSESGDSQRPSSSALPKTENLLLRDQRSSNVESDRSSTDFSQVKKTDGPSCQQLHHSESDASFFATSRSPDAEGFNDGLNQEEMKAFPEHIIRNQSRAKRSPYREHLGSQICHLEPIEPSRPLSEYVRHAMRSIPQSVVIITASDGHTDEHQRYHGLTCSSFNTVSLDPIPIVSLNIRLPSSTWDAVSLSKTFIAHTLSVTHDAISIANHFSAGRATFHRRHSTDPQLPFTIAKIPSSSGNHSLMEPPLLSSHSRVNPITDTITFPYAFKCELLENRVHVADHIILTAKVSQVLHTPRGRNLDFGRPHGKRILGLSYADGRYRCADAAAVTSNPSSSPSPSPSKAEKG